MQIALCDLRLPHRSKFRLWSSGYVVTDVSEEHSPPDIPNFETYEVIKELYPLGYNTV
jgi:hypothetical protein